MPAPKPSTRGCTRSLVGHRPFSSVLWSANLITVSTGLPRDSLDSRMSAHCTLAAVSHTALITGLPQRSVKLTAFYRATAMLSAVYAVVVSVCLSYSCIVSKRLNVGSRKLMPHDSPLTLVF